MENFFLLAFIIIFTRTLYSNILLMVTLVWLNGRSDNLFARSTKKAKEFIIIIPVLREQKILEETLNHFLSMNYDLDKITIFLVSTFLFPIAT